MIPSQPILKIDVAEKRTCPKIAAAHQSTPASVETNESRNDHQGERLFQQPANTAICIDLDLVADALIGNARRGRGGEPFHNFPAPVAEIAARPAKGKVIEICFQDEARIGQKNKISRRWAKLGSGPSAPHDQNTRSAYETCARKFVDG